MQHPFVFLGLDEQTGERRGVYLEKNLLTFAGSRTGKGACHIIPNLLDWPHNAVVIDPSGEAAEATAEHRRDTFGGTVAVIDPYRYANVPESFRAAFNPLDIVRSASDLGDIAEGLIMRSASETQPHFNESAEDVIRGLMAFILEDPELADDERSLSRLPDLIAALQDTGTKAGTLEAMKACERFGGLARQVAQRLSPDNTEVNNILGTLRTQTRWLDEETEGALSRTGFLEETDKPLLSDLRDGRGHPSRTFDLGEMKEGRMTLYLVLPGDKLGSKGRFLRLFTRLMLAVMMRKTAGGQHMGERSLFILDEAYALGRISEVVAASGQMAKYGLHLWPFFQSIGQITELYGREGLEILTEDANALTIFGVQGQEVCKYASDRMGAVRPDDVEAELMKIAGKEQREHEGQMRGLFGPMEGGYVPDRSLQAARAVLSAKIGKPRFSPDQLRQEVRKHEGEPVPRRLLMFTGEGCSFLAPLAHFQKDIPQHVADNIRPPSAPLTWLPFVKIGISAGLGYWAVTSWAAKGLIANYTAFFMFWFLIAGFIWWCWTCVQKAAKES